MSQRNRQQSTQNHQPAPPPPCFAVSYAGPTRSAHGLSAPGGGWPAPSTTSGKTIKTALLTQAPTARAPPALQADRSRDLPEGGGYSSPQLGSAAPSDHVLMCALEHRSASRRAGHVREVSSPLYNLHYNTT
ncbi:hypothetical protein CesoFtcFv8_023691 [Champsocephalus esox]|uniref:Uncharacterized protein n=1 Tax=Champsocephalus esox TaxID=159716 RepID=A0AAN8GFJ6_9TELE|nr:hypothetical protein CesoFtcFv8_023691 [Champsocephalus esox]